MAVFTSWSFLGLEFNYYAHLRWLTGLRKTVTVSIKSSPTATHLNSCLEQKEKITGRQRTKHRQAGRALALLLYRLKLYFSGPCFFSDQQQLKSCVFLIVWSQNWEMAINHHCICEYLFPPVYPAALVHLLCLARLFCGCSNTVALYWTSSEIVFCFVQAESHIDLRMTLNVWFSISRSHVMRLWLYAIVPA